MRTTYHTGNCGLAPEPVYLTPAEAATLAGLREGRLVAVPREPLEHIMSLLRLVRCFEAAAVVQGWLTAAQEEPRHD